MQNFTHYYLKKKILLYAFQKHSMGHIFSCFTALYSLKKTPRRVHEHSHTEIGIIFKF